MSAADNARHLVQIGATGEIAFEDGFELPPSPIIALAIHDDAVLFWWLADDHEHGIELGRLSDGDDGDVLARSDDGITLRIWGIYEDEHWAQLRAFVAAVQAGEQPAIGLGPEWTRYREL